MRLRFAALLSLVSLLALPWLAACERSPPPHAGGADGVRPADATADAALLDLDARALAAELAAGRVTAERVTRASLARIAALDDAGPRLNAIIETNPDALAIARDLDARFAASGPVGPLHGIPVVLKANIATRDALATSAGSLALAGHRAAADAEIVTRLRAAGAVIVAKANMSEWANFRSPRSTSGWSSAGGQTANAYVLDRNPCGSSSGSAVAVAARFVPLAVGTETNGSIVCPAGANGVVGIKPTHGRVSRDGIVPLAASFDTAGPLARTVADAAFLLAVLETSTPRVARTAEPQGSAARTQTPQAPAGDASASPTLRGVRVGVVRDYPGARARDGHATAFAAALRVLANAGAELVDPLEIDVPDSVTAATFEVMLNEFKDDIDGYLGTLSAERPHSLAELVAFNDARASTVMPHFGQELFELALERGGRRDPRYAAALAASRDAMRVRLAAVLEEHALDALVAPVNAPAWRTDHARGDAFTVSSSTLAAVSGFPSVAVPSGLVGELPVAVAFIGGPDDEARLVAMAAAFEHARGQFPAPRFLMSTDDR